MDTLALVMAGGGGRRMRMSGVALPKPLVTVRGVTLLERNIHALLRHGFGEIVVSVPRSVAEIGSHAASRCAAVAAAAGATLTLLEEERPLGNIGCAGALRERASAVIVVYADNLTTLDLTSVLAVHRRRGASLTLATHLEPLKSSYGELSVRQGNIVAYREKPTRRVLICSAVSVLGAAALAALGDDKPMGLVDLFEVLKGQQQSVVEFRHEAPWIDVNDAAKLAEAEAMVTTHAADFECWWEPPTRRVDCGIVTRGDHTLLHRISSWQGGSSWTLPSTSLLEICGFPGLEAAPVLAEFDDLEPETGRLARYRVTRWRETRSIELGSQGLAWVSTRRALNSSDVALPVVRALAACRGS